MSDDDLIDILVDSGVLAYKERRYKEAIEKLHTVLDVQPRHWRAKLYMAMSYYYIGEVFSASRHFTFLRDYCTERAIQARAESALAALNRQLMSGDANRAAMPQMTCTMKRPSFKPPETIVLDDVDDEDLAQALEWVDTRTERV